LTNATLTHAPRDSREVLESPAAKRRTRRVGWTWLQVATHVAALTPLVWLLWDTWQGNLTVNPIADITSRTGKTALLLLVLSLAVTPANTVFGWRRLIPSRRPLGVYACLYALLHFLTFTVLDYGLDPLLLQEAIFEKKYALVGFTAFLILLPLALTSTQGWMKRLGKRWKQLHKLVYLAAVLVVVHFVWLVKADIAEPVAWGAVIALLLALRIPSIRRTVSRRRTAAR
jgi:sulfoxide reductase heme-binding subunit YedZ